jgi:peptidoglycan/LPS O-acetylase OafA/YrhL
MSADGPLFWMLMGMIAVLTGGALWSFAQRRGWVMTWWKWVLAVLWYALFSTTFYAAGTLVGEFEPRAGLRVLLVGLFLSLVLGVGLVRVLAHRGGGASPPVRETGEA